MSDNGRKRCRKSKLVPRDCADIVEEDSVLQEPAQKKLLLQKIKKETEDYVPPDTSAHEFSVKVEIEDIDGSVPEEDPSNYMQYLFSLSKESQNTDPIETFEFADNSSLLENKLALEDEKNCYVDIKKVQRMLATLHKKYPNDKEAVVYTRNQWGKALNERYVFEYKKSIQDDQLQDVLRQWRNWTIISKSRESPFCYKCYICGSAWWSFTEFRMHLTIHKKCKLQLETQHQECNIVAYEGNVPEFNEVYVNGKCLKCAKTYGHHLTNKAPSEAFYYCNYCKDKFYTCRTLAKHEGACNRNPIRVLSISQDGKEYKFSDFSCQVCNTVFLSNPDLTEHLVICHKVRSDEPILTKFKTCKFCNRNYYTYNFHICLKKNLVHECTHCHAKFQNKQMLENHLLMWNNVVRCRICDKFLRRGCMAGEHYALHSENFTLMHRCLVCKKKMKVFVDEDAIRDHRIKYHSRINSRRPHSDMIIMAKIMLQQCMLDPNAKKTIPAILRENKAPAPAKAPRAKVRGEPMQRVRVYVPVQSDKNDKTVENSNKESQMLNITISLDNTVSSEEVGRDIIIKEEKDMNETNENKQIQDNKEVPVNEQPENSNIIIKCEKFQETAVVENETSEQNKLEKESEGSKDLPKLMEELNEFLDIKPDIIKVKEEKLSDDEASQGDISGILQSSTVGSIETESDLSKVFQSSSTFAEEVTANSEHSKVFQVSKSILGSHIVVKQEIKEEPEDIDDLIILDSSSVKQESVTSESSEVLLNLEPEVILKAGYRKRKVYKCCRCDYSGFHREYKEHINNECKKSKTVKEKLVTELIYKCTKCGNKFANIKRYALHFEKHGYRYMSCPQCSCSTVFDSTTKLVAHINAHIKNQFVRMQVISDSEDKNSKVHQCKTCKEIRDGTDFFEHWEKHLVLVKRPEEVAEATVKVGAKGELSLEAPALREVIELLTLQERTDKLECKRIKTCNVCDRVFERRNDAKRHLIEHLLEDAFANIAENQMLKCQMCGHLHKKPDEYKKHMRDHASLPIYQCSLCNKTFSDSSNFTKHKKIHNLKAYVCDICSKKFQAKPSLVKHMEIHMTTDPIKCERCDKVFNDRSFYKRHYRQYHDKLTSRFKCPICRQKFNALREKWDHMWLVHKQRKDNADCPICKVSYRKFSDVKRHAAAEHGIQVTLSNVWTLLNKLSDQGKLGEQGQALKSVKKEPDSDDDCLLIEEERETLVVYD